MPPDTHGQPDAACTKSIIEAIQIATSQGAIAIGARVNGPKGVLTMPPGIDRLNALKATGLLAVELSPLPSSSTGWLDPAHHDAQKWLDGSQTGDRRLSKIWCSDGHSHGALGRRFT